MTQTRSRVRFAALALAVAGLGAALPDAGAAVTTGGLDDATLARRIESHLEFLASDALGGRETSTVHGDITARYIASVFQSIGLQPAGDDGGFLCAYPLVSSRLVPEATTLTARAGEVEESFTLGEDFVLRGSLGATVDVSAGLVFVGHGVVQGSSGIDDYAGLDVEGRVVVVLGAQPEAAKSQVGRSDRAEWAAERGAVGMIVIMDPEHRPSQMFFGYMSGRLGSPSLGLGAEPDAPAAPDVPYAWMQPEAGARLLALAGRNADEVWARRNEFDDRGPLEGAEAAFHVEVDVEHIAAHNVVGVLPGSDPELAGEYVVVSAHMDHIGVEEDGTVNNGADDNASGTTTLMTVAESLVNGPAPRRSVVFLSVSGEEKGMLGSSWWVDHPTVPLESIIGNVNIDMIGRNDPVVIGATPSPDHPDYNTLVTRSVELAPDAGLAVEWETGEGKYRRKVDVYYARSDHYYFAKKGIPVVFFFSGEHEDYHKPTDTLEKIDQGKLARMARFVSTLLGDVADADERPVKIAEG